MIQRKSLSNAAVRRRTHHRDMNWLMPILPAKQRIESLQKGGNAQDSTSLNGKILRLNIDGSIPDDNPVKGSYVWAWGSGTCRVWSWRQMGSCILLSMAMP